MFDKLKAALGGGAVVALLLTMLESATGLEFPEGSSLSDIILKLILWVAPVLAATLAGYFKREKTGYGATTTVVTTGGADAGKTYGAPL